MLSNPTTNGRTKAMIFFALIALCLALLFTIITICLLCLLGHQLASNEMETSLGILGGIGTSTCAGITYAIKSFFETRESTQKHKDKIEKLKSKQNFKLEMFKLKSEARKGAINGN